MTTEDRTIDILRETYREALTPRTELESAELAVRRYDIARKGIDAMLDAIRPSGDSYLLALADYNSHALLRAVLDDGSRRERRQSPLPRKAARRKVAK